MIKISFWKMLGLSLGASIIFGVMKITTAPNTPVSISPIDGIGLLILFKLCEIEEVLRQKNKQDL